MNIIFQMKMIFLYYQIKMKMKKIIKILLKKNLHYLNQIKKVVQKLLQFVNQIGILQIKFYLKMQLLLI